MIKNMCYQYYVNHLAANFEEAQAVCVAGGNLARVNFYDCNYVSSLVLNKLLNLERYD